jgi:hypothetical protein
MTVASSSDPRRVMTRALRLAAASAAERERLGNPRIAYMQPRFERTVAMARAVLGAGAAAAWTEGHALTMEQAIAEALADDGDV